MELFPYFLLCVSVVALVILVRRALRRDNKLAGKHPLQGQCEECDASLDKLKKKVACPVTIERDQDTWLVRYVDPQPHRKKIAATFCASEHPLPAIQQWILMNPQLYLVENDRTL